MDRAEADSATSLDIRELQTDAELASAFPLMKQLRDRLEAATFVGEVRRQQQEGYQLWGGYAGERLVTLAGIRISHTLSRGPHLFVDDLVTDADCRGKGHGTAMVAWLRRRAGELRLPRVYLDSRDTARGFYERAGFTFLSSIPCWVGGD